MAVTTNDATIPNINGRVTSELGPAVLWAKASTFASNQGAPPHGTADGLRVSQFTVSTSGGN